MAIVTNCIHINSLLKKRTYAEDIADAPEEEDELLAKKTCKDGKKKCTWKICIFYQKVYYKRKKTLTQVRTMSGQMSIIKAVNRHDVDLADVLMEIKNGNCELKLSSIQ